jgi:hypothetical protein
VVGGDGGIAGQIREICAEPQGVTVMSPDRLEALSRSLADPTSRRGLLRLVGVGVAGTAVTAVGLNEALAKNNKKHRARKSKNRKARAKKQVGGENTPATNGLGSGTNENNPLANIPVEGVDAAGDKVFAGTLKVKKFVASNDGQIEALAMLAGTIEKNDKTHQVTRGVRVPVRMLDAAGNGGDVSAQQLECEVLHLELGPLDLNLLGLQVHLDQVVLDITADPTGGILGQLLCALAGGGPLAQIIGLLNQILAILQGL